MYYAVLVLYVADCLVLMLVVLLQQGKGGDIASAFGGGSSQAAFGARSGATVLSRATAVCAALFMVCAIALGILGQRGPGSVIGGRAPLGAPPAATKPVVPAVPGAQPSRPAPPETPKSSIPSQGGVPATVTPQAPPVPAPAGSPAPAAPAPAKP